MTKLNFKELLQAEIDKVQGYVDVKQESIMNAESNLAKDKNQLGELQDKLKYLLEEQKTFLEFIESKNSKVAKSKTAPSKEIKDDAVKQSLDNSWDKANTMIEKAKE